MTKETIVEETKYYKIYQDSEHKDFYIEFLEDSWILGPYKHLSDLKTINKKTLDSYIKKEN